MTRRLKTLRLIIEPSGPLLGCLDVSEHIEAEGCGSPVLCDLQRSISAAFETIAPWAQSLLSLADELEDTAGDEYLFAVDAVEEDETHLEVLEVIIDSERLATWAPLPEMEALISFLSAAEHNGYEVEARLSNKRITFERAEKLLRKARVNRTSKKRWSAGPRADRGCGGRFGRLSDEDGQPTSRPPSDVQWFCASTGISFPCSIETLKRAYRRAAREHHPDLNPGKPEAATEFHRLTSAFQRCLELIAA